MSTIKLFDRLSKLMMKLKNRILRFLTKNLLKKNLKFKNVHNGESCYIFGNGASLKYYDLKKFSDKIAVFCGPLFLHEDFNQINAQYFYEGQPFFFYPFWNNPYRKKRINKNSVGPFYSKMISLNERINCFISVSNYFGLNGDNIYYAHHFDEPFIGYSDCGLDSSFTAMASGLSAMIGLAIYMGFTDITLVGCDYTFFPQASGHFYEVGKFPDEFHEQPTNEEFLRSAGNIVKLRTMVPNENYKGHILPSISYEEFSGIKPKYRENNEIFLKEDLLALNSTELNYKIFK